MSSEITKLELSIEEARRIAKRGQQALALADVKAFKELILDGYFKDESIRLVGLLADPNMQDEFSQAMIVKDMYAIGRLKLYLQQMVSAGNAVASDLEQAEEFLAQARAEEATGPVELAEPADDSYLTLGA